MAMLVYQRVDFNKGATLPSPPRLLCQLRMQWALPGPERHITSSGCCGAHRTQTHVTKFQTECQIEYQIDCQNICQIECR